MKPKKKKEKKKETAYINQAKRWSNNNVWGMEITKQLDRLPAKNKEYKILQMGKSIHNIITNIDGRLLHASATCLGKG